MARVLQTITEEPRECSYLPERVASLEHRLMLDVTSEELGEMIERGFRRFGPDYFRPGCAGCDACVSTRVPTATFAPNKSQRRALKSCARLRVEIGPPSVDAERLALYHAWHGFRERERDWPEASLDARSYYVTFAFPHPAAREVAYYDDEDDGRLVAVGISDETPRAWSLVYFYYDPAWAERSIGTANVARQIQLAGARGKPYAYLGYRVSDARSMQYKLGFRPQEILIGRPGLNGAPDWVPFDPTEERKRVLEPSP